MERTFCNASSEEIGRWVVKVAGEFLSISFPVAGLDVSDVELSASHTATFVRFCVE
jgi:hypothetical protein